MKYKGLLVKLTVINEINCIGFGNNIDSLIYTEGLMLIYMETVFNINSFTIFNHQIK